MDTLTANSLEGALRVADADRRGALNPRQASTDVAPLCAEHPTEVLSNSHDLNTAPKAYTLRFVQARLGHHGTGRVLWASSFQPSSSSVRSRASAPTSKTARLGCWL